MSTSIISIAYGLEVKPENDHNIQLCEAAIGQLSRAALHGYYLVDVVPILKHVPSWIPGAGFKAYAEEARPKTMAMLEVPYGEARERIVSPLVLNRISLHAALLARWYDRRKHSVLMSGEG